MNGWCPREPEVAAAVIEQRRLGADRDELMTHAESCDVCREVVMVARLLVDDHEQTRREVRVPAAGQVWWRAAVRARLEAVHATARPLTWLHGVAAAFAIGLVMTLAGISWPFIQESAGWLVSFTLPDSSLGHAATLVTGALQRSVSLVLVAGACLVLAPLALFLVLSDE